MQGYSKGTCIFNICKKKRKRDIKTIKHWIQFTRFKIVKITRAVFYVYLLTRL